MYKLLDWLVFIDNETTQYTFHVFYKIINCLCDTRTKHLGYYICVKASCQGIRRKWLLPCCFWRSLHKIVFELANFWALSKTLKYGIKSLLSFPVDQTHINTNKKMGGIHEMQWFYDKKNSKEINLIKIHQYQWSNNDKNTNTNDLKG